MAVLKRAEVAPPVTPKETAEVPALGGQVVVRGLLLSERMAVQQQIVTLRRDTATPDPDDTASVHAIMPVMLALCVLDADGLPLFTKTQWQTFGGAHADQAITLFNTAWRLSGFNAEAEAKN